MPAVNDAIRAAQDRVLKRLLKCHVNGVGSFLAMPSDNWQNLMVAEGQILHYPSKRVTSDSITGRKT
ncbi:MAG: hypothetical protein LBP65_03495 [Puniceicoccales bacterium]|jgi:hypothetical protein|nr:hypothetical protein [Puniceicoccales bacterium]